MPPRPKNGPAFTTPGGPPGRRPARWGVALSAVLAVYLAGWLGHGQAVPPLWSPVAGLGLALVAWFGRRFALACLAGGGLLVVLHAAAALGLGWGPPQGLAVLPWLALTGLLDAAEPVAAWWLYHTHARGSRRLADPRSATQFIFLVPGVVAGASALLRAAGVGALAGVGLGVTDPVQVGGPWLVVLFWLARALGVLVVAPPLLVALTPWLTRRGLVRREGELAGIAAGAEQGTLCWGDWLETAGLAAGASILCLMLGGLHGRRELLGWQLWGIQILLIVWASLRQGLRGGTVVAGAASAAALLGRQFITQALGREGGAEDALFGPLLQAHLLAQCAAAVLVAAAASWVRLHENGYRQIVAHIPVVVYSARLRPPTAGGPATNGPGRSEGGAARAEITLVSAASTRLLGCPADQLLGDYGRWLALVHPDDREIVRAAVDQLARQDQPVTCEYRILRKEEGGGKTDATRDGGGSHAPLPLRPSAPPVCWLRDTLAPHRDAEGRLLGWDGVATDITEQRVLADDLRRTTSMLHALVANLPTGVFFVQGPHGQPILVNARARELLGQREDASAGLEHLPKVYRLFRPDGALYPAEELPVWLALRQGRTTMRDDIVVHRPDGRRVPLVTWAAPVDLGPGVVADGAEHRYQAAVWVLEDLTALHQAEAARKDSEGRLRAVIETMAEGLLVHDGRGAILTCNPAACAIFGQPAEALRGRTLPELDGQFLGEGGAPLGRDDYPGAAALRTARPVRNAVLGVCPPQGQGPPAAVRWLLVNAMPLGEAAGRTASPRGAGFSRPPSAGARGTPAGPPSPTQGVVVTFSDISPYIHAREAMRQAEGRCGGLVESVPLAVLQSDRDRRVTDVNPMTRAVTGYDRADLAGPGAWEAVVHPDDRPRVREIGRNALAGQAGSAGCRYRARDGEEKEAYLVCQPRTEGGAVVGTTTLLLDVTRERQREQELRRAGRLELVGGLSAGVAHDFNTLLGVVRGLADLAGGRLPADHPVHADLRHVAAAGEQAAALATHLQAFGRQGPAPARRVGLNGVTRRTVELLRATLPAGIRLETDLADDDPSVHADETQLQQVLVNLCHSASDAMPDGGVLRVSTAVETAAAQGEERPAVRLSVQDGGRGPGEEARARVFRPSPAPHEAGAGLGLAVVQQIVESYGGALAVHRPPGQGARFDVRWPPA
jgi:PAS domain S-box-containing protein